MPIRRPSSLLPGLRLLAPGLFLLAAACASNARPAGEEKWVRIFDGRSLAGWTPKMVGAPAGQDPLRTFIVEGGAIRVSYANYDKFGGRFAHLFYREKLGAFRLRLRFRMLDPWLADAPVWTRSNSGVMFLSEPPGQIGLNQDFPVSLELQLLSRLDAAPRPTGAVCTPGTYVEIGGKKAPLHCTPSNGPTLPSGRWTRVELDVLPSGEIVHRIDGREVHRYANPRLDPADPLARTAIAAAGGRLELKAGYLALQSEGHPVEFANIEIQRLGEITGPP